MEPVFSRETIVIISVGIVALAAGYEFLGLLLLAGALYYARANRPTPDVPDAHTLVCVFHLSKEFLANLSTRNRLWTLLTNLSRRGMYGTPR